MPSSDSFKQDILKLRELFDAAPLLQFEEEKKAILKRWTRKLPNRKKQGITELSDVYTQLVKETSGSSIYTPVELVEELFEKTPWNQTQDILDCSGGTGNIARPFAQAGGRVTLMDTDETALVIAQIELEGIRTSSEDFLKAQGQWDLIIGNPPWEGHRTMTLAQKEALRQQFPDIMGNKADLHFAFFAKAHELLKEEGVLSFFVARYWLEAESAKALREFILNHFTILYLHDWYGKRPFGAGVDPILIILQKNVSQKPYSIPVIREDVGEFIINSSDLSCDSMKLLTQEELKLSRLIKKTSAMTLGEAGTFYQGIITGFDKAFIMTTKEAQERGIEEELLVDWIKSSDLRKLTDPSHSNQLLTDKRLVYADAKAKEFNGFMAYIKKHRERLESRREVKSGARAFYQLQWGRERNLFESKRILFPYKAPASLFVPAEKLYHSADVYSYVTDLDKDWLCELLNSPIYDRYIKTELKKLGGSLYEYYPHRLKQIQIPDPNQYPDVEGYLQMIEHKLAGNSSGADRK